MSGSKITIAATISADANKVWKSWTNPSDIQKWNFAADDWQCPRASNDLRVGGKYSARMEAKDGSFGFDFTAVYDEVVDGKRMTYTMEDGRKVTTTFQSVGDKTEVKTIFDAEKVNPEEMQKQGWLAILNNFKRYVEAKG